MLVYRSPSTEALRQNVRHNLARLSGDSRRFRRNGPTASAGAVLLRWKDPLYSRPELSIKGGKDPLGNG